MMFKRYQVTAPRFSIHQIPATLPHQLNRATFLRRMRLLGQQLFRQPIWRRVLYLLGCGLTFIAILLLGLSKHPTIVAAQTPTPVLVAQMFETPIRCQYNAYVMRLNDFNFVDGTFFIDVWLSANCNNPDAPDVKSLEFPTGKTYKFLNTTTVKLPDKLYFNTNIEGRFIHDWDLTNYPFDRHGLELVFEGSGEDDLAQLVLEPDVNNSGLHSDLNLEDGWEITKFTVESDITTYATNLGYPSVKTNAVNYSRLIIGFDIQRTSYISFMKLVAGVYIAFIICALCVFFDVAQNELFTASIGTLVACLFAVFVNLQVAQSLLGTVEGLTLVDEIHIITMIFIVLVCVMQTVFHWLYKDEKNRKLRRIERLGYGGLIGLYVLINISLIVSAHSAG